MAEHFRDAEGQDVLLFIDNIFRFTQVGLTRREVMYGLHKEHVAPPNIPNFVTSANLVAVAVFTLYTACQCGVMNAGQLRGVCPTGSYPLCCGLPANIGY